MKMFGRFAIDIYYVRVFGFTTGPGSSIGAIGSSIVSPIAPTLLLAPLDVTITPLQSMVSSIVLDI